MIIHFDNSFWYFIFLYFRDRPSYYIRFCRRRCCRSRQFCRGSCRRVPTPFCPPPWPFSPSSQFNNFFAVFCSTWGQLCRISFNFRIKNHAHILALKKSINVELLIYFLYNNTHKHTQWFFAHDISSPYYWLLTCKDFMFFGKFDCNVDFCFDVFSFYLYYSSQFSCLFITYLPNFIMFFTLLFLVFFSLKSFKSNCQMWIWIFSNRRAK